MEWKGIAAVLSSAAIMALIVPTFAIGQSGVPASQNTGVPRLVKITGTLKDASGNLLDNAVGAIFAVYAEQTGGTPLWQETRNVQCTQGHYTIFLGESTAEGIPGDLFASGQPRWLGVRVLQPGEQEQPRFKLASVPYALKAGDADTLGGLPASAFLRASDVGSTNPSTISPIQTTGISSPSAGRPLISSNVTTSGGTVGTIPLFSTSTDIENSPITDTSGTIGINGPLSVQGAEPSSLSGVTGGITASSLNNVINPLVCGGPNPPSWCSGSELGAWINAAIQALPGNGQVSHGCGIVQLPAAVGSSPNFALQFSTQIVKPLCTTIDLNQSTIQWTGTVSYAIVVSDAHDAPAEPGGIKNGRIWGGTGSNISASSGILLGDASNAPTNYATNQTFYDLEVQNFTDNFVIGSNAYSDTWVGGLIALSGNAGIHFKGFSGLTNEGENFSFHGTNFGNNEKHDILVDSGALAEINANGTSFDYAGFNPNSPACPVASATDSISSSGILFLNASSSHFERCYGAKFINCSGTCSVAIGDSVMFLSGNVGSTDAFGQFASTSNASFMSVDFDNIGAGSNALQQLFVWSNNTGSLSLTGFRNVLGPSLSSALLYSGSAPSTYFDSRAYAATGSAGAGHTTCWKATGQIGYCSSGVGSNGACTCN
jgi:hypothetical protein